MDCYGFISIINIKTLEYHITEISHKNSLNRLIIHDFIQKMASNRYNQLFLFQKQ
jgi:hypothetical protein